MSVVFSDGPGEDVRRLRLLGNIVSMENGEGPDRLSMLSSPLCGDLFTRACNTNEVSN